MTTNKFTDCVLAIDIGSSSIKAGLFSSQCDLLEGSLVSVPHYQKFTSDGGVEENALLLRSSIESVIDGIVAMAEQRNLNIITVAIDSMASTIVGLDKNNNPVTPFFSYADTRNSEDVDNLKSRLKKSAITSKEIYEYFNTLGLQYGPSHQGIKEIYQYRLFEKKNQHIIKAAQTFLKKELKIDVPSNPIISIDTNQIEQAKSKYEILNNQLNILLGIGGSGKTKRIPSKIYIKFMQLCSEKYDCRFFLAT